MVNKMNTSIFATFDKSFDINCPVIKWDEPNGFNAIPFNKYSKRNISFEELVAKTTQFTVHWSVTYTAASTFSGLKSRGLSCNFIIGDDCNNEGYATIYQTLPLIYAGWSQGGSHNTMGPGVEISYMPQAYEKDMYTSSIMAKQKVPSHETVMADVHGQKLKVHIPTKAQSNSLVQLIWGFSELFPNIPMEFPKDQNGKYITTNLKDPMKYSGLMSHYHITRGKIDTAGLDYAFIEKEVAQRKLVGY